jgi:hypothetical protein
MTYQASYKYVFLAACSVARTAALVLIYESALGTLEDAADRSIMSKGLATLNDCYAFPHVNPLGTCVSLLSLGCMPYAVFVMCAKTAVSSLMQHVAMQQLEGELELGDWETVIDVSASAGAEQVSHSTAATATATATFLVYGSISARLTAADQVLIRLLSGFADVRHRELAVRSLLRHTRSAEYLEIISCAGDPHLRARERVNGVCCADHPMLLLLLLLQLLEGLEGLLPGGARAWARMEVELLRLAQQPYQQLQQQKQLYERGQEAYVVGGLPALMALTT